MRPEAPPERVADPRLCIYTSFLAEPDTGNTRLGEDALAAALDSCERGNQLGCAYAGELLAEEEEVEADVQRAVELLVGHARDRHRSPATRSRG